MTTIHPTTYAIVSGLRGEAPVGSPIEQALTRDIHKLVTETDLKDAEEIAAVGADGWDLGFRREATRYGISARHRDTNGSEVLISALFDRRKDDGWSHVWILQRGDAPASDPAGLYRNGTAQSFAAALEAVQKEK